MKQFAAGESRVPVSSVRRIVIKHSESIETAEVFWYVRLLVENPRMHELLGFAWTTGLIFGILWE
jgi:uncharacterized membrane protein